MLHDDRVSGWLFWSAHITTEHFFRFISDHISITDLLVFSNWKYIRSSKSTVRQAFLRRSVPAFSPARRFRCSVLIYPKSFCQDKISTMLKTRTLVDKRRLKTKPHRSWYLKLTEFSHANRSILFVKSAQISYSYWSNQGNEASHLLWKRCNIIVVERICELTWTDFLNYPLVTSHLFFKTWSNRANGYLVQKSESINRNVAECSSRERGSGYLE